MRSLFVYWKLPAAELPAALQRLRALNAEWLQKAAAPGLQARLYQRPQADAQGRLTCMATYQAATGLDAKQLEQLSQAAQAALPGGHFEVFEELPG